MSDNKKVSFKIIEVDKIKFFENDPNEIGVSKPIKQKVYTGINTHLNIHFEKGTIDVILEIDFKLKDRPEVRLFGIKTKHVYQIQNISNVVKKLNENEFNLPNQLLAPLISIAYSGTRGMLNILVTNRKYSNIILPIINPIKLIPKHAKNEADETQ